MTADRVRAALVTRCALTGLREASGRAGGPDQAKQVQTSFAVLPRRARDAGGRQQSHDRCRVTRAFAVRVTYAVSPKARADGADQLLVDEAAIRSAVLTYRADELQPVQSRMRWVETADPVDLPDGGRYLDVVFDVTYDETLSDGAIDADSLSPVAS